MIRLALAILAAALALAWVRREREVGPYPLPRHLDPAICHAARCATGRTGRQHDCDCASGWAA